MKRRYILIGVLLTFMLLIGCSMTAVAADWVKIGNTTYNMTNTATRIDADIALLDYKAQGLTSTVTASIGGTSYSGYTAVYNAMYDLLVANCTHRFPATGTPNAPHSTGAEYIWPIDSQNDAIWYIPKNQTATFQQNDAGLVGRRLVVVGGGTIRRVMDQRRFYLTGNSNLVLCLQGQLTIDGGGAPGAKLAILSVASGKVYIAGSVKIKDSHGQAASDSGGGGAITQRGGTIYMMDSSQILNCNSKTTETDPEPETNPNPYYISHGGAVAMFGGTFKMMGNAKISGCTSGYGTATQIPYPSLGGAVYLDGGTFTMNGNATIENCDAIVGGAVYIKDGTFTMNGGLIGGTDMTVNWSNNTTTTYPNVNATNYTYITDITVGSSTRNRAMNAGAIYAQAGTVTLNGGVIAGNQTTSSATHTGILFGEDNQYNGAAIATYYGSCILMQGTAKFACSGTTIYGNRSVGCAVFLGAGLTSGPNTNNTFTGGQVLCNFSQTGYGCGVAVTSNVQATFRNNTKVSYNTAQNNGGGMLVLDKGVINMYDNVEVNHNTASGEGHTAGTNFGNGGGFRVVGELNVYGGSISYNYARGWEVYQDPKDYTGVGGGISATSDMSGGGDSPLRFAVVNLAGGKMEYNKASNHGGAVYLASSVDYEDPDHPDVPAEFTIDGTEISHNIAARDGGGCYLTAWNNGRIEVSLNDGDLKNNEAGRDGGGLCVAVMEDVPDPENPGTNLISAGHSADVTIGDTNSGHEVNILSNTANTNGGGVALKNGDITVKRGNVKSNSTTTGHGGGIYVTGGDCEMEGGTISDNEAAQNGGGIYMAGGDCNMSGGSIGESGKANKAVNGAGIYANGTMTITSGDILYNEATGSGGGIYANSTVNFSNGNVNNNKAKNSGNGGGVCISSSGTLNISGTATMTGNTVVSGQGGGVYQGGVMTADGNALTITGNTRNGSKNNVYLPNTKTIRVLGGIDPTGVNMGIYTQNEAVQGGADIPVLTSTAANANKLQLIYDALLDGSSRITDDREVHKAKYPGAALYTLYFTKIAYDFGVFTDSEPFANPINSPLQLYKYMCWVNGLNGFTQKHATAEGNVTADINMGAVVHWIPIGEKETSGTDTDAFSGTFNGNGHVISNLQISAIDQYTNYGLFGRITTNAQINDVFVEGCNYTKSGAGTMGALVGLMQGGTVKNSIASGSLTATNDGCITGGLVGSKTGGTIHSSSAMPQLTGYQMGGLAGSNGGNIYNSYANGKFISSGTGYVGGLVGVNTGVVENCYAREQSGSSHGSTFGYLAGANQVTVSETTTKGNLNYCYAPNTPYTASSVGGNQTGVSTYTATSTPYQYKHADNQIATVAGNSYITNGALDRNGLKGLLATLNKWVGSSATYSKWMRTSASPINDDYPIHNYTDYVCVGSTDNISLEYSNSFTTLFDSYLTANSGAGVGTVYLYKNPGTSTITSSNNGKATELYIQEDVVLLHSSVLKAHVGITLDNSAGSGGAHPSFGSPDIIDWHFFSSALTNAQIGLEYDNPNHAYGYWDNPPDPQFTATSQYFPMNLNSYYGDWDLYSYCERDYHWINLKRNSFSHWHEDADWVNIPYPNETVFNPGQGFMVALKEEGYLQAYGTLNSHDEEHPLEREVKYTDAISWTTRQGQNLLGNPYQSYLDFDAFANDANNKTLWSSSVMPFYIIMDEDEADYVTYTKGQTANEARASRYLHPHQGFMIKISNSGIANFDNTMRKVTMDEGWSSTFRGDERPNYALVNLFAKDASGNRDMVTVELGRPESGGLRKTLVPSTSTGRISCYYENEDYDLAFTKPGITEASIHFKTEEDTEYTMTWSTQHGDFGYLHLIDNMTGADIDCLSTDEYKFSSRTSDYESRFRLVFGYTGIEEPEEDGSSTGSGTCNFAFMMGGQLVVNGEGTLQMFDVTGRLVSCTQVLGEQNTVSLPTLPAGVYMLRLEGDNGTQTQKIVIR